MNATSIDVACWDCVINSSVWGTSGGTRGVILMAVWLILGGLFYAAQRRTA